MFHTTFNNFIQQPSASSGADNGLDDLPLQHHRREEEEVMTTTTSIMNNNMYDNDTLLEELLFPIIPSGTAPVTDDDDGGRVHILVTAAPEADMLHEALNHNITSLEQVMGNARIPPISCSSTRSFNNGNEDDKEIFDSLLKAFTFPNQEDEEAQAETMRFRHHHIVKPLRTRSTISVHHEDDDPTATAHIPNPTPVAPVGIRIVPKVEMDEVWRHDESNKELVKWLLSPRRLDDSDDSHLEGRRSITDSTSSSRMTTLLSSRRSIKKKDTTTTTKKLKRIVSGVLLDQNPPNNNTTNNTKMDQWDERMKELIQYKKQYGHCSVPHNWKGNKPLAHFVKRQRYQGKLIKDGRHSTLTKERIEELNEIGFIWSSHEATWDEKFHALQEFSKHHGHCNVPSRFPLHPQLSVWVRCQRRQYKVEHDTYHLNPLTFKRFQKLQSIGFDFNPRNNI